MSPLLFSLFISDIEKTLEDSPAEPVNLGRALIHILLFADDVVLLAKSVLGLKTKIRTLAKYFKSLGLDVNVEKTQVMIFNSSGH